MNIGLVLVFPDATPGSGVKKEHGGLVWKGPAGSYYTQEVVDPNATECGYNSDVLQPAIAAGPPIPGSDPVPVATYHTHPSGLLEPTYGCGNGWAANPNDGKPVATANPDDSKAGGGGPEDWGLTTQGFPVYTITKTGRIYRLEQTWINNRSKNPNKWELQSNAGCPTKIP